MPHATALNFPLIKSDPLNRISSLIGNPFHAHKSTGWAGAYKGWDTVTKKPTDIALKRHFDGFNVSFADGHSKWVKWENVWWRDDSYNVNVGGLMMPSLKGNFDPRMK